MKIRVCFSVEGPEQNRQQEKQRRKRRRIRREGTREIKGKKEKRSRRTSMRQRRAQRRGLMPLNVILGELEDNEIVESALKCLKKALPLTFLVVDLLLLLPCVVRCDLQETLDIPEQGLRTRDRGILRALRNSRGYLGIVQGLRTLRTRHRKW